MRLMARRLKNIFFIPRVNGGPKVTVTVKVKDTDKHKITDIDKVKNQINFPIGCPLLAKERGSLPADEAGGED